MSTPQEDTVNVCLSEILGEVLGEKALVIPEEKTRRLGRRRRFDIKIEYKGIEYILEASFDRNDAVRDAMSRIEEGLIDTVAIALYYNPSYFVSAKTPSQIKQILLEKPLEVKVFVHGLDISKGLLQFIYNKKNIAQHVTRDWINVRVDEFGELLNAVEEFVVKGDVLSELLTYIEENVNNFVVNVLDVFKKVPKIRDKLIKELYRILFSPSGETREVMVPNVPEDVLLAHSYISLLMASILYESVAPQHGLDSLQKLLTKHKNHPLLAMKEAFSKIIEINYEPAFDIAIAVLDNLFVLQSCPLIMKDLRNIIDISQQVVGNKAILRQDFIGYIYHKITGNIAIRKGYATFYTKPSIAYFLAFLSIHTPCMKWNFEWSDLESLKNFMVCDFACGSGTLLSASYEALLSKYRKDCFDKGKYPDFKGFHKTMLENSIWGFDALEHAAQTASIVLSLHEPGIPLKKMKIYHIPVDEKGSLGSLNLWWANTQLLPIKRRGISEVVKEIVTVPKFNLIIMNPPFSRTTAPGEKGSRPRIFDFVVDTKTFEKLWKEYKRLIKNVEEWLNTLNQNKASIREFYEQYVGQEKVFRPQDVNPLKAGAAFPFIILADRYLKEGGRLALVLPKTVLESAAFFLVRSMLLTKYHIEYIVVSSEENNPNFSYSTDLSEILLIARKLSKEENLKNCKTYIINFKKQPNSILDGIVIAKEIINQKSQIDGRKIISAISSEAEVFTVSKKALKDFIWNFSMLIDLPPMLRKIINEFSEGSILGLRVPIYKILNLSNKIGINLRVVHPITFRAGNLNKYFSISPSRRYRVLKKTGKGVIYSISLDLAKTESIVPNNVEAEKVFQENSGRLIVPEALRFNTTRLVATWSSEPLISPVAFVINVQSQNIESRKVEKALCVWLNSTPIITYLRALFSTVEGKYGHIRGWHIRVMPVPDLSNLRVVDNLNEVFNSYVNVKWESLPNQYEDALNGIDMTRLEYDLDILKALASSYNLPFKREIITTMLLAIYREILEII